MSRSGEFDGGRGATPGEGQMYLFGPRGGQAKPGSALSAAEADKAAANTTPKSSSSASAPVHPKQGAFWDVIPAKDAVASTVAAATLEAVQDPEVTGSYATPNTHRQGTLRTKKRVVSKGGDVGSTNPAGSTTGQARGIRDLARGKYNTEVFDHATTASDRWIDEEKFGDAVVPSADLMPSARDRLANMTTTQGDANRLGEHLKGIAKYTLGESQKTAARGRKAQVRSRRGQQNARVAGTILAPGAYGPPRPTNASISAYVTENLSSETGVSSAAVTQMRNLKQRRWVSRSETEPPAPDLVERDRDHDEAMSNVAHQLLRHPNSLHELGFGGFTVLPSGEVSRRNNRGLQLSYDQQHEVIKNAARIFFSNSSDTPARLLKRSRKNAATKEVIPEHEMGIPIGGMSQLAQGMATALPRILANPDHPLHESLKQALDYKAKARTMKRAKAAAEQSVGELMTRDVMRNAENEPAPNILDPEEEARRNKRDEIRTTSDLEVAEGVGKSLKTKKARKRDAAKSAARKTARANQKAKGPEGGQNIPAFDINAANRGGARVGQGKRQYNDNGVSEDTLPNEEQRRNQGNKVREEQGQPTFKAANDTVVPLPDLSEKPKK